jgi:hypothetical protein
MQYSSPILPPPVVGSIQKQNVFTSGVASARAKPDRPAND